MTEHMRERLRRWRLVLGPATEAGTTTGPQPGASPQGGAEAAMPADGHLLDADDRRRDALLDALYSREYDSREYDAREHDVHGEDTDGFDAFAHWNRGPGGSRRGGRRSRGLDAPEWLRGVRNLFPARTAEYLQREGLQRYGLVELLADPQVLARATPDMALVRTLIACRSLLPDAAMAEARRIIRRVTADLEQRLAREVRARLAPRRLRGAHGGPRKLSELDWPRTLRRNLRHYDIDADALVLRELHFHARQQRHLPWELVLLVDQSGSMLDSVIHAAVLASVLCGVRSLKTRLVLFDTRIVDLGDQLQDPAETLLGVQLGGGTDIGSALRYAGACLQQPARSLVVLISDFHEGGDPDVLPHEARRLVASGARLIGLAALDRGSQPDYDRAMARRLAACGMPVAAMTPERLADWIAVQMR